MGLTKVTRGVIEPFENYDANNINATGIVTASTFVGEGSGLTGVRASGVGIEIKDSGSIVGVAGTIDFGTNLNVSPASAGIVTITVGDTDLSIADKIVHTGDTDTAIRFPAADTVTIETAGTERVRVSSAGSFGIGASSPTQKLEVNGAIVARGTAESLVSDGIYLQNKGSSIFDISAWRAGANASILTFSTDSGSDDPAQERMRIDSSGNVGIGTDDLSEKLTIDGNLKLTRANDNSGLTRYLTIEGSRGSSGGISAFGKLIFNNIDNNSGATTYDAVKLEAETTGDNGGELAIFTTPNASTTAAEVVRITSAGNVGIGTDNPTEKLHVLGDARITGILTVGTASITIDGDGGTITATTFSGTATNLSDAANITTGTLADARIPDLNASKITTGTLADARIPDLNASKITAGTLADARIPSLDAGKITSGSFGTARIPSLDAGKITSGSFGTARIPSLDASKITSGSFGTARIPNLDASKITAGTFSSSRIPNLDASKITAGTFSSSRIPNLSAAKITSGTLNVNITASRVTDEVATSTAGTKGSYAFLGQTTNTARSPNYTVAGSSLLYANANGPESGSPGGSWRLMGRLGSGEDQEKASVWVRYA